MRFDTTIRNLMDREGQEPDDELFGLEFEVEGVNLPDAIKGYQRINDGSLRGEAAEYIFKKPVDKSTTLDLIDALYDKVGRNGFQLQPSNRTSIHVHVNVQGFTEIQVCNLLTVFLLVEDALIRLSGDNRNSNIFCMKLKNNNAFLRQTLEGIGSRDPFPFYLRGNDIKYSSLNLASLITYGTVEFRSMELCTDRNRVKDWVNICSAIRTAALEYEHPSQIIEAFMEDSEKFVTNVFGSKLVKTLGFKEDEDSVLNAALIAYEASTAYEEFFACHEELATPKRRKKDNPNLIRQRQFIIDDLIPEELL